MTEAMHYYRSQITCLSAAAWICLLCGGCEIRDAAEAPNTGGDGTRETGTRETGTAETRPAGAAARIDFESFERGRQSARSEQKPLLVFFTAGWCRYCHQMANETFTQEAVIRLSRRFVCVLVDADAEPQLCREFEVHGFPTVQFMSPGGVRLNRVTGKQAADEFIGQMNAALNTLARRPELTVRR